MSFLASSTRRVPPGGRSTIVFGSENSSEEKAEERLQATLNAAKTTSIPDDDQENMGMPMFGKKSSPAQIHVNDDETRGFMPASEKVSQALGAFHSALATRGTDTLVRLGKSFRIMDDDNNRGLCYEEFKKGLRETGVKLEEQHCQALFRFFDADCSGYVSFNEFMVGVRPTMNSRRLELVQDVFASMDINNDGALTVQDVSGKYDCSLHPDVVSGSRTEIEVLQTFLAGFDGSLGQKTGIVTKEKFVQYYSSVSASVDDDDYFELILRNTWHLSGSNTSARRLLVTKEDGSQSIEEIEGDIDISKEDLQEIRNKLREQGVPVVKVALYGYVESGGENILSTSLSPKKKAGSSSSRPQTADVGDAVAAYKQRMSTSNVMFA